MVEFGFIHEVHPKEIVMVRRIGVWMVILVVALIWASPASVQAAPPGWAKGNKKGWKGGGAPSGWSKGKKKGWKGKNVPPG